MMRVVRNYLICAVVCFGLGVCFSIAVAHFLKKDPNEIIREKVPDLCSSNPIVQLDAVKEISRMGTEALPFLLKLADSHDEKEREMAVHVLGEIGAVTHEDILPVLRASLNDGSASVRESAALSILRCCPAVAQRAIPDVLKASAGTSIGWQGKEEISKVLHNMGPPALEDIPAIEDILLKDENAFVRFRAACVLSDLGPRAQPALDSLLEALKDKHSDVRVAACHALGWKGNVAAISHLEYVAKNDKKEWVRKCAKWALETIAGVPTENSGQGEK